VRPFIGPVREFLSACVAVVGCVMCDVQTGSV